MIKDNRRIDPLTGQVREPHGGATGPAGGASPFPGGSGPGAQDPTNPNNAAQPLSVDLSAAELDLARQEAAERTADLQRVTAEYANYRKRVDRDREVVIATGQGRGGARHAAGARRSRPGARSTVIWSARSGRSPTS